MKRNVQLVIRLTAEEKAELEKLAEAARLSLSSWCRMMLLARKL